MMDETYRGKDIGEQAIRKIYTSSCRRKTCFFPSPSFVGTAPTRQDPSTGTWPVLFLDRLIDVSLLPVRLQWPWSLMLMKEYSLTYSSRVVGVADHAMRVPATPGVVAAMKDVVVRAAVVGAGWLECRSW